MLNDQALSQLSQLKSDIQASKEYGTGTIAGTNGRFGFVRLDDGRDAYLSPDKMSRVIPGDVVKVSLKKNDKDKLEADLEELIESPLKRFEGQYRTKGGAHFVAPIGPQSSRWIFLPPKARGKCKEGDFVISKLTRHPFQDGKAQAKVVERIGQANDAFIEYKYIIAKHNLSVRKNENENKEVQKIQKQIADEALGEREDLSAKLFVTIDAESTTDMDDALHIEKVLSDDGQESLHLSVAIADPSSFIRQGSALAFRAQKLAQTIYLQGGSLPMLPEELSNHCFSLVQGEVRPALVCKIEFDASGAVSNYSFCAAKIRSAHKLNYNQVADYLDKGNSEAVPEDTKEALDMLHKLGQLRLSYRKANHVVGDEQMDYRYTLDNKGKISAIDTNPRSSAHQIVEEAMVATNCCAGDFLQSHSSGLHSTHGGFREDRLGEVKALLKEEAIQTGDDINELNEHLALLQKLAETESQRYLLSPLKRLMQPSELSLKPGPHIGMGLAHYATITSPIRRFGDLYNHWAIYHCLNQSNSLRALSEDNLAQVSERLQIGRQADRELQLWLLCQFTKGLIGKTYSGKIRIVTQHGFGVRLHENGIDGFILFPKKAKKSYDAKRMTLSIEEKSYQLDQEIMVKVASVDDDKKRIAFELVEQNTSKETENSAAETE